MKPDAAGKVIGEKRFLGKISRRTTVVAFIILIIVAGGLAGWNFYLHQFKRIVPANLDELAFPLPDKPSIAVLPFENLSRDPDQEYFADGMTEDLITGLAANRHLSVVSRNSTFAYKGQSPDIRAVGRDLGVAPPRRRRRYGVLAARGRRHPCRRHPRGREAT